MKRFILGRAGSGKTRALHELLVQTLKSDPLGASVILIVPKQATFSSERAIASDPRLKGFINLRVIAPDDLGELALIESGYAGSAKLDSVGRSLILSYLLRMHADELEHFNRSASQPGLAAEIDGTFSELERAGRDLCEIDDLIDQAQNSSDSFQQSLARKLRDLCRLYRLYQQYLKDHQFDAFYRQALAVESIENCRLFQQSLVLVDDFHEFTVYERQLLTALIKTAREAHIAMLVNPESPVAKNIHYLPEDQYILRKPELAYRKLHFDLTKAEVHLDSPLLLTPPIAVLPDEIHAIERGLLDDDPNQATSSGHVTRIEATDYSDEVDESARQILSLMQQGFRLRDICVLARSIEDYDSLIDTSFAEHGIAFFTDKRRAASHHPLVRTLMALCDVSVRWSHEAVVDWLRAGLHGQDMADVDLLHDYIRQHNVPAYQWGRDEAWEFHRPTDEEDEPQRSQFTKQEIYCVNELRQWVRKTLAPIVGADWMNKSRTVRQRLADLFDVIDRMNGRPELLAQIAHAEKENRILDRDQHLQTWARVVELADQMVSLLGDVVMSGADFVQVFQQTLGQLDLAVTPPTLDQVLVGSIERTRVQNPRAVILLGMNAGQFPRATAETAILNDQDRQALQTAGVEVRPGSRQSLLDERFLGYLALTRSTERLVLIRAANDTHGHPLAPSIFWHAVDRCIKDSPVVATSTSISRITTPRQAISAALQWARLPEDRRADRDMIGLYNWIASAPTDAVRHVRDRAWPVLRYENLAILSAEIAAKLYRTRIKASVSRFETFASCPFKHFARYGLRLQTPPDPDITAMDLGNLYHSVLEKLVRKAITQKVDFTEPKQISPQDIHEIAVAVGKQLRHQIFMTSPQSAYTLECLEEVVKRLLAAQQYTLRLGGYRPAFAELVFGEGGDLPPLALKTEKGHEVILSGKIDRLDLSPDAMRYIVTDYKLGGQKVSFEQIAHGLMLQLLTYLLVIDAHGEKLTGHPVKGVAALYVKLLRSIESIAHPDNAPEPATPDFFRKNAPRGLILSGAANEMDAGLVSPSYKSVYSLKTNKDGGLSTQHSDAVDAEQFQNLIIYVHNTIIRLADQMIGGDISVTPYLIGDESPCPRCEYQRVCRFDPLINSYRILQKLDRDSALAVINGQGELT